MFFLPRKEINIFSKIKSGGNRKILPKKHCTKIRVSCRNVKNCTKMNFLRIPKVILT